MAQGWVCVHRKLLDNPIFKNDKLFRVFMFCLLRAQHTAGDQLVGDSVVYLDKGQLATGRISISEQTGLSQQNVRTAISKLEKLGILTIKPTTKYSVITMVNWNQYQQTNQQVTNKQPTSNQQVTTSNNVNNEDNENKLNVSAKPKQSKFKFDDDQMRFAEAVYKKVEQVTPQMKKPNLESWANIARLMVESDKFDLRDVWNVFLWANSDSFWRTNILSVDKLRKKYPELKAKAQGFTPKQQPSRPQHKEFKL